MSTTAAFIAGVVAGGLLLTIAGFLSGEIKGLKHKRQTAHTIRDTRQLHIPTDAEMPDIASFEIKEIEEIENQ